MYPSWPATSNLCVMALARVGQAAAQRALDDALDDLLDRVWVRGEIVALSDRGWRRRAVARNRRGGTGDVVGDFFLRGLHRFFVVFLDVVQVFVALDVQRLAELAAVAVEGVGLEAELPAEVVAVLDVVDGGFVGQVDRLGDRPADERLGGGHHADVAFDGDVALCRACRTCWRSRRRAGARP